MQAAEHLENVQPAWISRTLEWKEVSSFNTAYRMEEVGPTCKRGSDAGHKRLPQASSPCFFITSFSVFAHPFVEHKWSLATSSCAMSRCDSSVEFANTQFANPALRIGRDSEEQQALRNTLPLFLSCGLPPRRRQSGASLIRVMRA
jgi:hypothetical protein